MAVFVESTVAYIYYPRYESTVVEVESEWEEQSYTDSDGRSRSRSRQVLMHNVIVEFVDNHGQKLTMPNSISSGDETAIGDKITISYKEGKLQEFSFRAIAMYFGLAFMLLVWGCFLLLIYNYNVKKNNEKLLDKGTTFLVGVIVPGAMLLMLALMSYALLQYFSGNQDDMPLIVVITLSFFCFVLFFAVIGYVKMLFSDTEG